MHILFTCMVFLEVQFSCCEKNHNSATFLFIFRSFNIRGPTHITALCKWSLRLQNDCASVSDSIRRPSQWLWSQFQAYFNFGLDYISHHYSNLLLTSLLFLNKCYSGFSSNKGYSRPNSRADKYSIVSLPAAELKYFSKEK